MSLGPKPPGRSELKYRLSPFLEMAGAKSLNGELTMGPRLTGAAQSENFEAAALYPTRPRTSRTVRATLMLYTLRFIGVSFRELSCDKNSSSISSQRDYRKWRQGRLFEGIP